MPPLRLILQLHTHTHHGNCTKSSTLPGLDHVLIEWQPHVCMELKWDIASMHGHPCMVPGVKPILACTITVPMRAMIRPRLAAGIVTGQPHCTPHMILGHIWPIYVYIDMS